MVRIVYLLLVLFFYISCENGSVTDALLIVYKTNDDYSSNIYVTLNTSKTKVTSFPGVDDVDAKGIPLKLTNGYYLGTGRNGENGIRSAVTSQTINTYTSYIGADSLFKLVIDSDPFLEYYQTTNTSVIDHFSNNYGIDTLKLNEAIKQNQLDEYFKRLK
jgi:hypothetical protein